MFRIAWAALVVGLLASFISDGNQYVVLAAMVGTVGLFAWSLLTGRSALKCPACGKRVKLGYSTCHHCGAQVGNPRAIGAPKLNSHGVVKQCSHCMSEIHPEASVCPHCQRDVQTWTLHEGRWWTKAVDTGEWLWMDDSVQWRVVEPGQSTPGGALASARSES